MENTIIRPKSVIGGRSEQSIEGLNSNGAHKCNSICRDMFIIEVNQQYSASDYFYLGLFTNVKHDDIQQLDI